MTATRGRRYGAGSLSERTPIMATLAECIRIHHDVQGTPELARETVVTPLGTAIAAGTRFVAAVSALDDRDRAIVLSTIVAELKAIEPPTPQVAR